VDYDVCVGMLQLHVCDLLAMYACVSDHRILLEPG
jgi:hypothetical protein